MTDRADSWTATVNGAACVGSGLCAASAPGWFSLDANGRATAPGGPLDAAEEALEAAENCPAAAISLYTADSGDEVFTP